MEQFMKPEQLIIDRSTSDADKIYKHWQKTFSSFVNSLSRNSSSRDESLAINKFNLLRP